MLEVNKAYEMLIEYGIATEAEVNLVTDINGYNSKSCYDILYARTGFRNFAQFLDDDDFEG